MNQDKEIRAPTLKEKVTLRFMIILGLLSFSNFFYWFFNLNLIDESFLFWLLIFSITYEILKVVYIWYHYWGISLPKKPTNTPDFTVDVFTTYFPGEPHEMVKETLLAIQRIRYPHTTYLCDEANDENLKKFCQENNIIHVTRNNRVDAKAGNINNALLQAKGELCFILDPDHVPSENFLDEVLPYFEDERIGFVQTVQSYYNVKQSSVARGASEQTLHFYGPIMMSMNSYGTVNAIGANCIFRRKALDSIGGHAAGLAEDMHTAMQLHAKGWKSVYVPKALTKGLAPASLTSYYKQQLKWSRGTFELLATVYPKLFMKFSWRQKIHYGILPFNYLTGISTLINFLIPVICLFAAITPWKGDMVNFILISIPVLISILGIRFYVQHWVIQRNERGIHMTGGILQICSWWIYIIGFIYTIIRRKIPYLPTPKEDKERTAWKILTPNLLIGFISIIAVIYGLSIDFTPFSIMMSGFAVLNALFMFTTLIFAYQKQKSVSLKIDFAANGISALNDIKKFVFQIWRKSAVLLIVVVITISVFFQYDIEYLKWGGVTPEVQNKSGINFLGVFAPKIDNGITDLNNVKKISNQIDENFDIISLYLVWGKNIGANFPQPLIDSIYSQKSIPMITWEPWLDSFADELNDSIHVYELIEAGYFDNYIKSFAEKLKNLHRPVFLRFVHEFDNPFYPWYVNGDDASVKFKKVWIHTYEIFKNNGATNVIWIWNPWKSKNVASFYPGKEYVDWIGVNILNYGKLNQDGKWYDFKDLYEPFHDELENLPFAPVIISEFSTIKGKQKQDEWLKNAIISINDEYKEIKSVVFYNSKVDNNWPNGLRMLDNFDWTLAKNQALRNSLSSKEVSDYLFLSLPYNNSNKSNIPFLQTKGLKNIRGINYRKGHNWRDNYHVLSRKTLVKDFKEIKHLGINTIKFKGNSVYDYNVLNISKEFDFTISYGFWIPAYLDYVKDTIQTKQLKQNILKNVTRYLNYSNISSWNIQNDVLNEQNFFYLKPRLLYQNWGYLFWLKSLIKEIKEIDSTRPIVVDLEVSLESIDFSKMLINNVEGIDAFGLVVNDDKYLNKLLTFFQSSNIEFLFSEIDVDILTKPDIFETQTSFFITSWQDAHESNRLTFNGLLDRKGRYRTDYFTLRNAIQQSISEVYKPKIRILKPATPIYENRTLDYHAFYNDDSAGWRYGGERKDLKFEWSLVKCDLYGNYITIKEICDSAKLSLKIPSNYTLYRLLLTTTEEGAITTTISTLNTPLEQKLRHFK